MKRRELIKGLTLLPLAGMAADKSSFATTRTAPAGEDLFKELGVRTFINAAGTLTYIIPRRF
jgi:hypothetical protein